MPILERVLRRWTGDLILRSLRSSFRGVYLLEHARPVAGAIVFANHHYWWDGYLFHLLTCHWRLSGTRVWMRDYRRFPPFGLLGAMPFPLDDAAARAVTIRRTVSDLQAARAVCFLLPEGELHPAPDLLPFQRSLFWLHRRLPQAPLIPMAIGIVPGIHQYPEIHLITGEPFACTASDEAEWLEEARCKVGDLLEELEEVRRASPERFQCILEGRRSISERWPTRRNDQR